MASQSDKAELRAKLNSVLSGAVGRSQEYDLSTLFDRIQAGSLATLSLLLGELVAKGKVQLVFRVLNPSGVGVQEFKRIDEIPDQIEDQYNDWQSFEVTPDRVRPVYKFE